MLSKSKLTDLKHVAAGCYLVANDLREDAMKSGRLVDRGEEGVYLDNGANPRTIDLMNASQAMVLAANLMALYLKKWHEVDVGEPGDVA